MYSELRKHLQANIVKRANTPNTGSHADFDRYTSEGVYNRNFKDIPRDALIAYNRRFGLPDTHGLPETLNATAEKARAAQSEPIRYTGESWGEAFADYGNRYLDGWRRGLGFESHYGPDPYLDAAGWANNIALSTIPIGGVAGALGRGGIAAARVAGRLTPLLAKAAPVAAKVVNAGRALGGGVAKFTSPALSRVASNFAVRQGPRWGGAQIARGVVGNIAAPVVKNWITKQLPRNLVEGAIDIALPGARLLHPLYRGGFKGFSNLSKMDTAGRILGSAAGAYNMYGNIGNAIDNYDRTGDALGAATRAFANHAGSVPFTITGPIGYVGSTLLSAPFASAARNDALQRIMDEEVAKGDYNTVSKLTSIQEGLVDSNPMRRSLAERRLLDRMRQDSPLAYRLSQIFSIPMNANPLGVKSDDQLVAATQGLKAHDDIHAAVLSGKGYKDIAAAVNKGLIDSGETPTDYSQTISAYTNYLESELYEARKTNNLPLQVALLRELGRFKNLDVQDELAAGRLTPNMGIENQLARRVNDSVARLNAASNALIARK